MAILKSEFSQGSGRLKEVAAFQYDDATGVLSTGASNLLALGAAGFSLSAHTLLHVALGTGAYASFNDVIASQGYVDEAVAGVTPGIPGDATYKDFTVAETSSFAAGSVVAITSSGLALADSSGASSSNAIGVVLSRSVASGAGTVRVQLDGEIILSTDLAAYASGDLVWVATAAGAVTSYTAIPSGEYAVQVGIVSDVASDSIILQPRIFGQTA
jgi:hypothetical protein